MSLCTLCCMSDPAYWLSTNFWFGTKPVITFWFNYKTYCLDISLKNVNQFFHLSLDNDGSILHFVLTRAGFLFVVFSPGCEIGLPFNFYRSQYHTKLPVSPNNGIFANFSDNPYLAIMKWIHLVAHKTNNSSLISPIVPIPVFSYQAPFFLPFLSVVSAIFQS